MSIALTRVSVHISIAWKEIARYLAINCQNWEWQRDKVAKFIPWRKETKGRPLGMTSTDVMDPMTDADTKWVFPACTPNQAETKIPLVQQPSSSSNPT